jgi:hypothetical protein
MAQRRSRLISIIEGRVGCFQVVREAWRVEQRAGEEPIVEQLVSDLRRSGRIQGLSSGSVQPRILTEDEELSRRVVEQKAAVDCSRSSRATSVGTRLGHVAGAFEARPLGPVLPWREEDLRR